MAGREISVTPSQVAAAKLRVATDIKLGRRTPAVIRNIAEAKPNPRTAQKSGH
jgi:hypothetical protein